MSIGWRGEPVDPNADLWRRLVNAVAHQEDYVKSLERRVESMEVPEHRVFVQSLLDSSRQRLIVLLQQFKEIDEGENIE